ncbi:MAG: hypothetical protein ACPGVG_05090 [Mycobacterium sp.]
MTTGRTPVVRRAVLTKYPRRAPEVGLAVGPASQDPPSGEDGVVIGGFVERVGDPVPLIAPNGSMHRGEDLTAEALAALVRSASPTRVPDVCGVAVPAHWPSAAVEAMGRALPQMLVMSDAFAALTALQAHPGLPARGVVALCDFGATGTSITLADAADGYRRIGRTVRCDGFSGDLLDQALLRYVLSHADGEVSAEGTSAVRAPVWRDPDRTLRSGSPDPSWKCWPATLWTR